MKTLFDQYFLRVRCLDALRAQVAARIKMPTQVEMPSIAKATAEPPTSMTFLPDELMDSDSDIFNEDGDDIEIEKNNAKESESKSAQSARFEIKW